MTAAFEYEDMHHLVDQLTPTQVRRSRLLVTQDEELSRATRDLAPDNRGSTGETTVPDGLLALIGAMDGPEDLADRHDDYVRERMRERFGDSA